MRAVRTLTAALLLAGVAAPAAAGEANVLDVAVTKTGETYRFEVTVYHADTGWEHYADAWDIVGPDGTVIDTRILAHPHVDEQPFRRSLTGVTIPPGVTEVTIRARDSEHGYGGRALTVAVPE